MSLFLKQGVFLGCVKKGQQFRVYPLLQGPLHHWRSGINTAMPEVRQHPTPTMSRSKTFFLVNSVYKTMLSMFMCRDPGDTTSKVHVVSSLVSVLKIAILMLALKWPCTPLKIILSKNETRVNLKSLFCCNYAFTQRFESCSIIS